MDTRRLADDLGAAAEVAEPRPNIAKTRVGAANADRILDAALTAFARHGLHGTRLEAIAEAAGLSKPNLLYYFRSKAALYQAVLTRTLEVWLRPLRELDAERDPAGSLTAYIRDKLVSSREEPEASRLFAMEVMAGAPVLGPVLAGDLAALVDRKVAIIRQWTAEGRLAPIDPRHLLFGIWATTQHYADFATQVGVLTGRGLDEPAFFEETAEAIAGMLLRGVLPR